MIRRPPRSTLSSSSAASDVYKRQPTYRSGQVAQVAAVGVVGVHVRRLLVEMEQAEVHDRSRNAVATVVVAVVARRSSLFLDELAVEEAKRVERQEVHPVNC